MPGRRRVKLTDPGGWDLTLATAANKKVEPSTALQLSTAWSCVRLLSETIATLPLGLYTRSGEAKILARENPLYTLLHDQPNADQTAVEFWEGMIACLCLRGNAFAEKEMVGSRLVALTPIDPDRVKLHRRENGRRFYRVAGENGRDLDEDDVFHLKGFGTGGDMGLSPIAYARESMAAALAADEAAARFFASGMQLSGFIETGAQTLKAEQRQQLQDLFQKFAGSPNAGKMMALEGGMKWVPLGLTPEDSQLLMTRSFNVEEICRWFRVPPFMVGHTEKSTSWGTGLEQQMIGFLTFSLRPYLTRIEQAVKKQLISPADRGRVFAEFNLEGLLRADSQGRAALYASAGQNGWMDRNEIRALENKAPREGADVLTVQSNLIPLAMLGQTPLQAAQPAPGEPV
jgi:HK97 family phage portal protein